MKVMENWDVDPRVVWKDTIVALLIPLYYCVASVYILNDETDYPIANREQSKAIYNNDQSKE